MKKNQYQKPDTIWFDGKTGSPTTFFWVAGVLFILFLTAIGVIPWWYFLVPA